MSKINPESNAKNKLIKNSSLAKSAILVGTAEDTDTTGNDFFYLHPLMGPSSRSLKPPSSLRLANRRISDSYMLTKVDTETPVITTPTSELALSTPGCDRIAIEDFSSLIMRQLSKHNHRNLNESQQSIEQKHEQLRHSWAAIYHNEVDSKFKYIDDSELSYGGLNHSPHRSNEFMWHNQTQKLRVPSLTDSSRAKASPSVHTKSYKLSTLDLVKKRSYVLDRVDKPGVQIKLTAEKRYEKEENGRRLVESKFRNVENVRLNAAHIDVLCREDRLHEQNANDAKDFYFHPHSLSFTPFLEHLSHHSHGETHHTKQSHSNSKK